MKKLSVIVIGLFTCILILQFFILASDKKDSSDQDYKQAFANSYKVFSPILPKTLSFADEIVPLDVFYVQENLDRAILMTTYWQSNTSLILKRAYHFFPIIEKILEKNKIPEDFKYLCVTESGLTNVTSPAKAQGYWQFIESTGKKYNLEVSNEVDERNCIEKSTQAACDFLNFLYTKFGSWTLAAAAYNCGEGGLSRQMQLQSVNTYYDLYLNQETSFYVYRILAFKLIMKNPQQYGFYLRKKDAYPSVPYKKIIVDSTIESLHSFAIDNGTSYKMLKTLNPWLTNTKLTNKSRKAYSIKLPINKGTSLQFIKKEEDNSPELITGF